jgi:hypothetical protein
MSDADSAVRLILACRRLLQMRRQAFDFGRAIESLPELSERKETRAVEIANGLAKAEAEYDKARAEYGATGASSQREAATVPQP